jgi:hypothetical protein
MPILQDHYPAARVETARDEDHKRTTYTITRTGAPTPRRPIVALEATGKGLRVWAEHRVVAEVSSMTDWAQALAHLLALYVQAPVERVQIDDVADRVGLVGVADGIKHLMNYGFFACRAEAGTSQAEDREVVDRV